MISFRAQPPSTPRVTTTFYPMPPAKMTPPPAKTTTLGEFPLELLKFIASYLPDLRDVLAFASVSRAFHAAIHSDQFVFRTLFLRAYEPPRTGVSGYNFTAAYQARTQLKHGRLSGAPAAEVARDILLDAQPRRRTVHSQPSSLNLQTLVSLPMVYDDAELQLLLAPALFDARAVADDDTMRLLKQRVHSVPALRAFLQRDYTPEMDMLTRLRYVFALFAAHLDPALHLGTFYQALLLRREERPGFWEGRLPELKLPTRWLAAYTYLVFPPGPEPGEFPEDVEESGDNFLAEFRMEQTAPGKVEGEGKDFRRFVIREGTLEMLSPESIAANVPGWNRIGFVKDYGSHRWRYEGVLLPGGALALGMWWDAGLPRERAEQGRYGVFMMWAIDEGCEELGRRDTRLAIR